MQNNSYLCRGFIIFSYEKGFSNGTCRVYADGMSLGHRPLQH